MQQHITLRTGEGLTLPALLMESTSPGGQAVLIVPDESSPDGLTANFATALAHNGLTTLALPPDSTDAEHYLPTALGWLHMHHGGRKLFAVGHGSGGAAIARAANHHLIEKLLLVATPPPPDAAPVTTLHAPILAFAFPDDALAPPDEVRAFVALFTEARAELRIKQGMAGVGHEGFFDEAYAATLWQEAILWLTGAEAPEIA